MRLRDFFYIVFFILIVQEWCFWGNIQHEYRNKRVFGGYSNKKLVCLSDATVDFDDGKGSKFWHVVGDWLYDLNPELEAIEISPPDWTVPTGVFYWPYFSDELLLETHSYLLEEMSRYELFAYMGFGNGGEYINQLVQAKSLGIPAISIGAAGVVKSNQYENELYLVVGKQDDCYEDVKKFYRQLKGGKLKVHFIKHDGGHEIPREHLLKILQSIIDD